MTEIEAYEYVIQLYPKCGLKTVAVFGMDITHFLKYGFRDVQYNPPNGPKFDCVLGLGDYEGNPFLAVPMGGIFITDGNIYSSSFVQIHSGKLNAYKRKL